MNPNSAVLVLSNTRTVPLVRNSISASSGAGANPVGESHDLGLPKLPRRVIPTGIRA